MNTPGDALPYVRLQFNIDNLELDDCYAEGYDHAIKHGDESANPFPESTLEAEHWALGWWDGFYQEKPLHNVSLDTNPAAYYPAVNDAHFTQDPIEPLLYRILKISGALFASAILGYQFFDFVA